MVSVGLLNFSISRPFLLPRNLPGIFQHADYKIRTLEGKLKIPPRPKRPLNPFLKFSLKERPKLKLQFPELKNLEISKKLGSEWAQLDQEFKMQFQEEYKRNMIEYSREMMKYERDLSQESKDQIKAANLRHAAIKEKQKFKAKLQELGKPKKPPTTFILYMLSKLGTKEPKVGITGWLHDLSKEWENLPPEEREKYEIESKKLMEQYKNDMLLWEAKMIRLGHIDVVRRQVLLDLKDKPPCEDKKLP